MLSGLPNPRYERKFVSRGLALADVLALVRRHPAAFREAYPPRMVNNVYLDTPALNSYHDHVQGTPNRAKTRVRWYGQAGGLISAPTLERKLKRGLLGGKMAERLPALTLNGEGIREPLERAFVGDHLTEAWRVGLRFLQPTVFNRYNRHYFVSADNRFRLTVDSEIRFALPENAATGGTKLNEALIVLELKFAPEHAEMAASITNAFPFRLARCSKYVFGIDRIGL